MREDIYGALKNAIERGESIESAVRSFINAGYNETEVREAAQALSSISPNSFIIRDSSAVQNGWPLQKSEMQGKNAGNAPMAPAYTAMPSKKEINRIKPKADMKLIVLVTVLLLLVFVLIASFFLKTQIINFFNGL